MSRPVALERRAIAALGTVDDLHAASFMFPDGTLLAWPAGTGSIRTRESRTHHPDIAETLTGQPRLDPLLAAGWMRVQNFRDTLVTTVGQTITPTQAKRLRDDAPEFQRLVVEAEIGVFDRPYCEVAPPIPGTINACVRRINTEIVEKRAAHEALLARMRREHPELLTPAQRGQGRRRRVRRARRP